MRERENSVNEKRERKEKNNVHRKGEGRRQRKKQQT
jgi:hypothetical protein